VIVDERLLGLANGLFDGMELLGDIKTRPSLLDHRNDAPEMAFGPLEPLDDIRMGLMNVWMGHVRSYPPP